MIPGAMEDPATEELLDRWMTGDARAAEAIYSRYVERIQRYAMKWTKDTVHAEEVAAEALAQALVATREGKRPNRLSLWILGISRNLAIKRHRLNVREGRLKTQSVQGGAGPETLNVQGELAEVLRCAIEQLPPSSREVIEMFQEENLDRQQIADRLGISRESVDRRFARAYDSLRSGIQRHVTSIVTERRGVDWEDVRELRPTFRRAFILRHLEGRTLSESAAQLQVPEETVEARLSRAYEMLGCGPADDFSVARDAYNKSL